MHFNRSTLHTCTHNGSVLTAWTGVPSLSLSLCPSLSLSAPLSLPFSPHPPLSLPPREALKQPGTVARRWSFACERRRGRHWQNKHKFSIWARKSQVRKWPYGHLQADHMQTKNCWLRKPTAHDGVHFFDTFSFEILTLESQVQRS